jgi:gliding motility-associated-like protein
MKLRILLSAWAICCFAGLSQAQVDTEFWFAAPYAVTHSPGQPIDRLFRFSSFAEPTTITVSQPANPSFPDTVIQLAANSSFTLNVSPWVNSVQASPPNTVLNYGFRITSTSNISAYYEITNLTEVYNNPDIFALKGKNALGTKFYTPFQTFWFNEPINEPTYSSFDIVATENNTSVTITPTRDLVGHPAGIAFTIVLNRGQVYSARATSNLGAQHPTGSKVVANKPIAITLKDDSAKNNNLGICADLAGDQLVPVNQLGTEYAVVRGFLNNNNDRAYVLATAGNTQVYINGVLQTTLAEGATYEVQINQPSVYIRTTQPAYVWHITGFGCEVGGAVLPALICRGSSQINFTRSNSENFGLILITKADWRDAFAVNGQPVDAAPFAPVPGTNGEWYAASLQFTTGQVEPDSLSIVTNSEGIFQMGIINGGNTSGCRYGYFSEYNNISVDLGPDLSLCEGQSTVLDATAESGNAVYTWQDGSTTPTFNVTEAGTYYVDVTAPGCESTDTIQVAYYPYPEVDLGPDQLLCNGATATLDATHPGDAEYQWQNGSQQPVLVASQAGNYAVSVTVNGCTAADTVAISTLNTPPAIPIGVDTLICLGDSLLFDATQPGAAEYLWQDGSTSPTFAVTETGFYSVTWSNVCGDTTSTPVEVEVKDCKCRVEVPTVFTPNGDERNDRFGAFFAECRFTQFQLRVYNRWGALVFSTSDPQIRWDGEYQGQPAPSDVYVWQLSYEDEGISTTKRGDVTLVR